MEHRCKSQQQQIFELKQELTNNVAELKLRLAQAEGDTHSDNTNEKMSFSLPLHQMRYITFMVYHTLTDRLEIEKRRSKQALEDMDSLRQKEVQGLK